MIVTDATHLPRLMNCNGSRLLDIPQFPDNGDDTIRNEGNAFHWLAQQMYDGKTAQIGQQAYNGVFITAAMLDHAEQYISNLLPGEMEMVTSWESEYYIINARADHIGTSDGILEVTDAKYGYGIVEPEDNWTLIAHAIGYVKNTGFIPSEVRFTIYQPRAYHPLGSRRTWTINYEQLCGFTAMIDNTLTNPSDMLRTGWHCYRCPSMSICPSYREANMNAIDATSHAFNDSLSADELSNELDLIEYAFNIISNRKKAIEELALFRVTKGEVLRDRMIDRPKGQTRYKKNINVDMLLALTGRDLAEHKLPAVSKLRDAGIAQTVIDAITERPEGSARLVKVDIGKLAQKKLNVGVK
jgi:hypothetical protein